MPTYSIEVTQEDIDLGIPTDATSCPVARALTRTINRSVSVGIGDFGVANVDGLLSELPDDPIEGSILSVPLPDEAVEFIGQFDMDSHRHEVTPFTFDVEIPI